MGRPPNESKPYFESIAALAEARGIGVAEQLREIADGTFGIVARPINPELVYYRADLEAWEAAGKPPRNDGPGFRQAWQKGNENGE